MATDIEKIVHAKDVYRWSVINICREDFPPYSYSAGFYDSYRHPEIIIFGLHDEVSTRIINLIGERIVNGVCFKPGNVRQDIFLCSRCAFLDVPKRKYKHLVYAGYDFPLLQLIWSDLRGYFPWEEEFSRDFFGKQLVL